MVAKLSAYGVKLNITAVFTITQISETIEALGGSQSSYISIFAGRIADAGVDPEPFVRYCAENKAVSHEIIWASPREAFNIVQAERSGAEIST